MELTVSSIFRKIQHKTTKKRMILHFVVELCSIAYLFYPLWFFQGIDLSEVKFINVISLPRLQRQTVHV